MRSDISLICSFKYFKVGTFILEGVVGKNEIFLQSFREERPQKRSGNVPQCFFGEKTLTTGEKRKFDQTEYIFYQQLKESLRFEEVNCTVVGNLKV